MTESIMGRSSVPFDENAFRNWYALLSTITGTNPDPDDPRHFYDHRAAYKAGMWPILFYEGKRHPPMEQSQTFRYHGPSEFKMEGHPNQIVEGVDTKTGKRVK